MGFRNGLTAAAAAAAIAAGAGFGLRAAQSFTIPTGCAEGAACAYVCRGAGEQGRTESDFIALAAYQLGPERPILLPPANLSMPAPVDPHNVYAGTGAGMTPRYGPRRSAVQEPEHEPPIQEPTPILPASRPEPVAFRPPPLTMTVIVPAPPTLQQHALRGDARPSPPGIWVA